MSNLIVEVIRGKVAYEVELDYTWEDRRNNLLNFTIENVTIIAGGPLEHDVDPGVFADSLSEDETRAIEEAIKEHSES